MHTDAALSSTRLLGSRKVLLHVMNYWPEFTSTGRYAAELGDAFVAAGAQLEVVTTPPHYPGWAVRDGYRSGRYGRENVRGVNIYRCPIMLRREMHGIWRIAAAVSFAVSSTPVVLWRLVRFRPDVLMSTEPTLSAHAVPVLFAKLLGIRTVLHVQDLELDAALGTGHLASDGLAAKMAKFYQRVVRRRFDRVVTISHAMLARLVDQGVAPARLSIIRNWVDLSKIFPLDGPSAYRAELSIPAEVCVVQYAGNVGAKQGLDVLLDAAEQLADRPDIAFVIAGDGPAKAGLIDRYGALKSVHFLPPQPEERLCELLSFADLHAIPQKAEASDAVLPSKLGGILASGKALVVTTGRTQELGIFLGDAAILVPAGDSSALARVIGEFAASRDDTGRERRLALAKELSSVDRLQEFVCLVRDLK